ncbi:tripartite tricarboxylate transporter TctB family protein [Bosea sp. LjRoot90]|uniref:tripartite tricarboxylate transporter TctB family protein n=1 Tax=Bosea sp. LjRoot90 TaxID=3342342 RepID=UPI003ECE832E
MEVTEEAPPAVAEGRSRSPVEIVFALVLVAVSVAAIATASQYPVESAAYPVTIAAGMAVLGGWIAMRELLRRRRGNPTAGAFAQHGPRLAIGVAALVAYFAAVSVVGFILPSLALCVLLPAAVGFRRWRLAAVVGLVCVVSILLIFVYALGRPIPEDLLSPLLAKLR